MKEGGYNGEIPVTSRRGMPLHGIIGPGLGRNEPAPHGFSGGTRSCRGAASTRPSRPRQTARGAGRTRFGAVDRLLILPFFHMPKDVRLAANGQRADRSDGNRSFPFRRQAPAKATSPRSRQTVSHRPCRTRAIAAMSISPSSRSAARSACARAVCLRASVPRNFWLQVSMLRAVRIERVTHARHVVPAAQQRQHRIHAINKVPCMPRGQPKP